jgi:putative nucleotidyltransferase with HDIG domain
MYKPRFSMTLTPRLRLSELLGALSYALDVTEGQPEGHCVRCCWIGYRIGVRVGLDAEQLSDLYYTLLLKDLGCSSNAARICQLYLSDDLIFKRDFKQLDDALPQVLRFVFTHTGLKAGLSERFRAILNIFQNGGEIARELIDTRCHRGSDIARRMGFSEAVALGIQSLDEHWDGGGKPSRARGRDIPMNSQIALLAQVVDVFHTAGGRSAAVAEARRRSGRWFDPRWVAALEAVAAEPNFWPVLESADLLDRILLLPPGLNSVLVDDDYLDNVAAAFAEVIDAKSPYTSNHSQRVTLFTDMIAEQLGLTPEHRRWLRRAALLHDIGKLGVSNAILDKPGKLDEAEWSAVRSHAALSEAILQRIGAFRELAPIAGAHHERLDGKGYPRGLSGEQIRLETRILTVADIFDALTAKRPYRDAMPIAKALGILSEMVGSAIDPVCFAALRASIAATGAALAA